MSYTIILSWHFAMMHGILPVSQSKAGVGVGRGVIYHKFHQTENGIVSKAMV